MQSTKAIAVIAAAVAVGLAAAQDPTPKKPQIQPTEVPSPVRLTPPVRNDLDVSRPLGAEEAASIALAHQLSVKISKSQYNAARSRTHEAEAGGLPDISLAGAYSHTYQEVNATSASSGYTAGATLSQLIYDFNVTRDTVAQAKALQRAMGYSFDQTQADVVLAAKSAFYAYAQDERLVGVAESNLKDREGQLALAKARFDTGVGTPQDVVLAQTNLDSAVLQLTQARSTALAARVGLAQTLGVDPLTPIVVQNSTEPDQSAELPTLIQLALAQRPEMLAAKKNAEAAKYGISIASKSAKPAIYFSLGANGAGDTNFTASTRQTIGVSFSWSIWDGGLSTARMNEAKANAETSKDQLGQVGQNVTTDVANTYIALKTAEQAVTITGKQVLNARESVRLAEGRYKAGITTFLEILDAQTTLTQAEINEVNAQSSLQMQRAALAHAIGATQPSR